MVDGRGAAGVIRARKLSPVELMNALLEPLFPVAKGIRLLGISLSSLLITEAERQPDKFEPPVG